MADGGRLIAELWARMARETAAALMNWGRAPTMVTSFIAQGTAQRAQGERSEPQSLRDQRSEVRSQRPEARATELQRRSRQQGQAGGARRPEGPQARRLAVGRENQYAVVSYHELCAMGYLV